MKRSLSIALAVLVLSACSTVVNRSTQEITLETPGTEGAQCLMEWPGYRMRVWTPKTVRITKGDGPMEVTCRAPGNREKKVLIEPVTPSSFKMNIFNGFLPGAIYDRESGAMYEYPSKIIVDFTGIIPQEMPMPAYQRMLDENPDLMQMEEFHPSRPALQRDKNYQAPTIQPRRTDQELFSSAVYDATSSGSNGLSTTTQMTTTTTTTGSSTSVVSTQPVPADTSGMTADELTRSMNPSVFGAKPAPASGEPTQLR